MRKFISIILALSMIIAFSGCGKDEEKSEEIVTNVSVFTATKTNIGSTVKYTGELKASEECSVSPKASGTVEGIYCEIGDYVTAGQTLAVLDDTTYRMSYNQALASYNQAQASYNSITNGSVKQTENQLSSAVSSTEIELNNATENYNRQKALYDAGAISKVALETAETRLNNAKINYESAINSYNITTNEVNKDTKASAQAAVDSAKAMLETASTNLANTRVVAPISGYIASKNTNLGQMASQGMEMFAIKDSSSVEAELSVTESIIPYIYIGTQATVSISSAGLKNIKGSVTEVNTVKNDKTGMYTVRVHIDNNDNILKVGMFADVVLETENVENAITIPSDSIMQLGDEKYVYIAKNDKAVKQVVETGIENNDFVEIKNGIKAGDKVIVSGKEYVSEKNNKIKIIKK